MSKIWFVTGANSGIGAGIAKAALAAGDRVVATGRHMEKLRDVFAGVDVQKIALVELDVVNPPQAQKAVETAVARFGRIDVLVNNAGFNVLGNFEEMTPEAFDSQIATNFFGVVSVVRAALPVLRGQRAGHIINISSVAGAVGFKHCTAYAASKFAVEGFSLSLAEEVGRFGVKVTIVEPGFFRTELLAPQNAQFVEHAIKDYADEETAQAMWSGYNGTQQGDPLKLGQALVTIAGMEAPPRIFAAGSDALAAITPAVEARLQALRDNAALSSSTDGDT